MGKKKERKNVEMEIATNALNHRPAKDIGSSKLTENKTHSQTHIRLISFGQRVQAKQWRVDWKRQPE